MFQTLDRYLLRQFLETYVICFCSLTGLYVVFDAFGHMDELVPKEGEAVALLTKLVEYYAYRSLSFFERISAMLTLISAMFTLTWFQRSNELTALWAAGVSTGRVVRPVIFASILLSLGAVYARECIIPTVKVELTRNPSDLGGEGMRVIQPTYDLSTDVLLQGRLGYMADSRISRPNFIVPERLAGRTVSLIAENAYYHEAEGDRPAGYWLRGVTEPPGFLTEPSLSHGDLVVVMTPVDHPWLKTDECFIASNLSFHELVDGDLLRQYSSTRELVAGLQNPSRDFGADARVLIHARLLQPLLDVTLIFVGLPFVLVGERRNPFIAVGACMLVTSLFLLLVMACHWLGGVGFVSPSLAAWLPLMLFAPVACWLAQPIFR